MKFLAALALAMLPTVSFAGVQTCEQVLYKSNGTCAGHYRILEDGKDTNSLVSISKSEISVAEDGTCKVDENADKNAHDDCLYFIDQHNNPK